MGRCRIEAGILGSAATSGGATEAAALATSAALDTEIISNFGVAGLVPASGLVAAAVVPTLAVVVVAAGGRTGRMGGLRRMGASSLSSSWVAAVSGGLSSDEGVDNSADTSSAGDGFLGDKSGEGLIGSSRGGLREGVLGFVSYSIFRLYMRPEDLIDQSFRVGVVSQ